MFILDIIVAAASAAAIILGFIRGIIKQIGYLGAIVLSFYIAIKVYPQGAQFLMNHITVNAKLAGMLSFVIIYFALLIVFLLITLIISKITEKTPLIVLDRILGMLFSFSATFLILATLIYSITLLPLSESVKKNIKSTFTYKSAEYIMNLRRGEIIEDKSQRH